MVLAVTGHRPDRINGQEEYIKKWLDKQIESFKPSICISGMAQGVDQIFAYSALKYNSQLWCILPYKKKNYHPQVQYLLDQAARITYTQKSYSVDCYTKRDVIIVEQCDRLLVVWDGQEGGGTYYTMKYAQSINKPIDILMIEPYIIEK